MTDKLLNENITVLHKIGEDSNGIAKYRIFRLSNVRFENRDSVYASNRGLKPYDGFKLYFIPNKSSALDETTSDLKYTSSINYENLSDEEKSKFWTVAENDVITEFSGEISPSTSLTVLCKSCKFYYVNSIISSKNFGKLKLLEITGRGRSVDSD